VFCARNARRPFAQGSPVASIQVYNLPIVVQQLWLSDKPGRLGGNRQASTETSCSTQARVLSRTACRSSAQGSPVASVLVDGTGVILQRFCCNYIIVAFHLEV